MSPRLASTTACAMTAASRSSSAGKLCFLAQFQTLPVAVMACSLTERPRFNDSRHAGIFYHSQQNKGIVTPISRSALPCVGVQSVPDNLSDVDQFISVGLLNSQLLSTIIPKCCVILPVEPAVSNLKQCAAGEHERLQPSVNHRYDLS